MQLQLLNSLFFALSLTITTELVVAWFFGFRKRYEITTIILVNLITNPLLNYTLIINNLLSFININLPLILLLEAVVVLVEWWILSFVIQENLKKLLLSSFFMNLCSFLAGILIFRQF